jgi:PKD repeat protein
VYALYDQVTTAGNTHWIDDSVDGIKEPLLDVSNATIFNPTLVPGSGGGTTPNTPPGASFTFVCNGLMCTFTDASVDSDGNVVARSWDFGDGTTSDTQDPSHTYAADGTYSVSLTVTDDDGATDSTSQDVTVSAPIVTITLSVTGRTVRGRNSADLAWSGATSSKVDVYRNSGMLTTTKNDGLYTDAIGKAGGTYTYQVCEAGTTTCSNEATVTF